jgi:PAS domain S-box-containing protein
LLKFFQTAASPSAIIAEAAKAQDTTDAAVIGCDARGTIVYWNEQASTLFGWPSTDALGRNVLDVLPTSRGDNEAVSIVDELRHGTPWRGQFVVRARDGTPIVAFISHTPVVAGKRVVGVVAVSRRERRRSSRGSGEVKRAD